MNFLFFIVHPSKFHVFKNVIRRLKHEGHHVDILISSKDVLEPLLISSGWEYINLFPKGRKNIKLPFFLGTVIYAVLTLSKLLKILIKKKYNLFITDDLLSLFSKLFRTPCLVFTDDDLKVGKKFAIVLRGSTAILAPSITDLGKFNVKKIGFNSYKELAYLHPEEFEPNPLILEKFNPQRLKYGIFRLISLQAHHDQGRSGLNNKQVERLIDAVQKYISIFISSERPLVPELEQYRINLPPQDFLHALSYADIYIGDSQTTSSEASVLGIPTFRCNDFAEDISVMNEKEEVYNLMHSYRPKDFDLMLEKIISVLSDPSVKEQYKMRRLKMLEEKINLSTFIFDIIMKVSTNSYSFASSSENLK